VDPSGDITRLISEWKRGDKSAENALFEALYNRLHAKALHLLHSEPRRQSMGPTALVHEAYLRLEGEGDARHSGGPGASAFY
jgi:DNA-directed RNA polymerase specialized sigma24 family protein